MLILYTGTKCPKCPPARKILREVAKELDWVEGKDFVEKLIDGADLKPGEMKLEGEKYNLVTSVEEIIPDKTPAALVGEDFSLEALMYQIASTPSFIIDEEPVFISQIPTKEELIKAVKERV
ncbi:MAG: hypothetical protein KAT37_02995 [Candidatus Aenigmarchaeota archaeon]|nr:hypothetical protein [Candidatus Aenigmarchaeota archaeon]